MDPLSPPPSADGPRPAPAPDGPHPAPAPELAPDPVADLNRFRLALALKINSTKPPGLSAREYALQLRDNIREGRIETSDILKERYVDACAFWKKRAEAADKTILELRARVRELEERYEGPNAAGKKRSAAVEEVAGGSTQQPAKKAKTLKSNDKSSRGTAPARKKKEEEHEAVVEEADVVSVALAGHELLRNSEIQSLLPPLRLLRLSSDASSILQSLKLVCDALSSTLIALIQPHRRFPAPDFMGAPPAKTRRAALSLAAASAKKVTEVTSIISMLHAVLAKVVSALRSITNKEFQIDALIEVVKMLAVFVQTVWQNTEELVSPVAEDVRDLRLGLACVVSKLFVDMHYEADVERELLEAFVDAFLRAIGACLRGEECTDMEIKSRRRVLSEEAGWYWIRMLEAVVPLYRVHCDGRFVRDARQQLNRVILGEFFCTIDEGKTGVRGVEVEGMMDSLFVKGLIGVLGPDIFEGIWV